MKSFATLLGLGAIVHGSQVVVVYEGGHLGETQPSVLSQLAKVNTGFTEYGLVIYGNSTWRDTAEPACGFWTDGTFHANIDEIEAYVKAHEWTSPSRSTFAPERLDNFNAILKATRFPWTAPAGERYILQITKSETRYYGDGEEDGMAPSTGDESKCRTEYSPSPDTMASAIKEAGCHLVSVVADGSELKSSAGQMWTAFNFLLGQQKSMIEPAAPDYSDVPAKVEQAVAVQPRRLSPAQPIVIDEGKHLFVRVGHRPDDFSVIYNGNELVQESA